MKFSHELSYDAPPAQVAAMLADPRFRERVCDASGAVSREVSVEGESSGPHTVVIDQTQPARGVPSFAVKFVGEQIRVVQRETWSQEANATFEVDIPGKPASFTGRISLAAAGPGTVETVAGEITVKVPLLGGKLESMVADLFTSALKNEQRVGRTWLAESAGS